jgi:hypothetical protein
MSRLRRIASSPVPEGVLAWGLLFPLVVTTILLAVSSVRLRMEHDALLHHYAGWMMNEYGLVPYRDFFAINMPGIFGFHALVGGLFGYGDLALRLVDVALLAVLAGVTFHWMGRFGMAAALAATVAFPLFYLMSLPSFGLQRDYLGLIPVAVSLSVLPPPVPRISARRIAGIGALFGLAALFKPHLVLGLPVMVVACSRLQKMGAGRAGSAEFARMCAIAAAGLCVPLLIAVLWLAGRGALGPFLEMTFGYLPLHNELVGNLEVMVGWNRVAYLWANFWRFGGYAAWVVVAGYGGYLALRNHRVEGETRLCVIVLLALAATYAVYPVVAAKFWAYHYLPFLYFVTLAAALLWMPARGTAARLRAGALPRLAFVVALLVTSKPLTAIPEILWERAQPEFTAPAPKLGRVDEIAAWLRAHAEPGDRAQPLDWTSGVLHAMLVAQVPVATPFLYDYQFYHHPSHPTIRALRDRFVSELRASQPRFVIRVTDAGKPWLRGPGTTREFPRLERYVSEHYREVHAGAGYQILERNGETL